MSTRYTDQDKAEILQHLDDNFGNVTLTALQTGVPTRTLYTWKRIRKLTALKNGEPIPGTLRHKKNLVPPPLMPLEDETDPENPNAKALQEYSQIRERLMHHIDNLIETLTDDPDTAHLRISALSRLLDRVVKLEALVKVNGQQVIRVDFRYPDGTIHDRPMWENPDYHVDVPPVRPGLRSPIWYQNHDADFDPIPPKAEVEEDDDSNHTKYIDFA